MQRGFNPTLVRLAPIVPLLVEHPTSRFNPTLVRLAHSGRAIHAIAAASFNPTLVRLAQEIREDMDMAVGCFNPTLVRLAQDNECHDKPHPEARFNPTLVRLAPGPASSVSELERFQSHLGSISTTHQPPQKTPEKAFQSHLGSISTYLSPRCEECSESLNPTLVRLALFSSAKIFCPPRRFQSHLGSISTIPRADGRRGGRQVSIPPWFD